MKNKYFLFFSFFMIIFSEFSVAAISVSPMTIDVKKTASVVPFEISVSTLNDSEIEVSIEEIRQDSNGNIKFSPLSNDNAKIITLEKGYDKKSLKKGDVWKLKGTYAFNKLKNGRIVNFAIMIRDRQDKNLQKGNDGMMLAKHYRYAVTIKSDSQSSKSRPDFKLDFGGLKRIGNKILIAAEVDNKSDVLVDFEATATIRDEKTKKIIETVNMRYFKDQTKKGIVRIFPLTKANIFGEIRNLNLRGRYISTITLKGRSNTYSKSSGIKMIDFSEDLFSDQKPEVDRKLVGVEIDPKKVSNIGFLKVKNSNFFPIKIVSSILETPRPVKGNIFVENTTENVGPGESVVVRINVSDVKVIKGVGSHNDKWSLKIIYQKQSGEIIREDALPIVPIVMGNMKEFWEGLNNAEDVSTGG